MPKVNSKRQITLTASGCKELGIEPGDEVEISVDGNQFNVFKKVSIEQLEGIVPKTHKTVSIEDMNETIKDRGSKVKPSYTLKELLAKCDPDAPPVSNDWDSFFDAPPASDDLERH